MVRWSLPFRSLVATVALMVGSSAAQAQRVVVSHDEWLTQSNLFNANEQQFMTNTLNWFGAGAGSSALIYSPHSALSNAGFLNFLTARGMTSTINAAPPSLAGYNVVFVGGNPGIDAAALAAYVQGGGNVYYMGGSGVGGAFGEAAFSNPFLNVVGLNFGSTYNAISQTNVNTPAFASQAPFGGTLFTGVNQLFADIGSPVSLTAPVAGWTAQVFSDALGNGIYGASTRSTVTAVPEPGSLVLMAVGLLAAVPFARRRKR